MGLMKELTCAVCEDYKKGLSAEDISEKVARNYGHRITTKEVEKILATWYDELLGEV